MKEMPRRAPEDRETCNRCLVDRIAQLQHFRMTKSRQIVNIHCIREDVEQLLGTINQTWARQAPLHLGDLETDWTYIQGAKLQHIIHTDSRKTNTQEERALTHIREREAESLAWRSSGRKTSEKRHQQPGDRSQSPDGQRSCTDKPERKERTRGWNFFFPDEGSLIGKVWTASWLLFLSWGWH